MTRLGRLPPPGAPRPRPLEEYACLADGRSVALLHIDGACDWWSAGRLDGPPRLARLLDARRGGSVAVRPLGAVPLAAGWDGETTVARVAWATAGAGAVEVRTGLVDGPGGEPALVWWLTGPPGTPVAVELTAPTAGSARAWSVSAERARLAPGGAPEGPCGGLLVTLAGLRAEPGPQGWRLAIPPAGGLAVWMGAEPAGPEAAVAALRGRMAADRAFVGRLTLPGAQRAAAVRAALTLWGLQDRGGGGCLAAPTTSLPQWPGSARTWDYRFAWLRDNADAGLALLRVGAVGEAAAVGAAVARQLGADPGGAAPVRCLDGGPVPPERAVPHLSGYGGARPVRVGNAAAGQAQVDVLGEVVRLAAGLDAHDACPPALLGAVPALADAAAARWADPDHGIWEARGAVRAYVHSRVLAWAACDRALALARRGRLGAGRAPRWAAARAAIVAAVAARGQRPDGSLRMALDDPRADSSVLAAVLVGFLPETAPAAAATLDQVVAALQRGPSLLRYAVALDGDPTPAGTFTFAGLWAAAVEARLGRSAAAAGRLQAILARAGPFGQLSECLHPRTGRLLGNYPQVQSHAAVLEALVARPGAPLEG